MTKPAHHALERWDLPKLHILVPFPFPSLHFGASHRPVFKPPFDQGHLLMHALMIVEMISYHYVKTGILSSNGGIHSINPAWFGVYIFYATWTIFAFRAIQSRKQSAFNLEVSRVLFFLVLEIFFWVVRGDEFVFLWYNDPEAAHAAGIRYWVNKPLKLLRAVHVFSFVWLAGRYLWFPFFGYDKLGNPLYLPGQPCAPPTKRRTLREQLYDDCILHNEKIGHSTRKTSDLFTVNAAVANDEQAREHDEQATLAEAISVPTRPPSPDTDMLRLLTWAVVFGLVYRLIRGPTLRLHGPDAVTFTLPPMSSIATVVAAAFHDDELWTSGSCGFVSFLSVSFICFLLEKCQALKRFRAQPYKPNEGRLTNTEWWEAFRISAFNLLAVHWPIDMLAFWYYRHVSGHGTLLTPTSFISELALCILFVEVWFYFSHRLLHCSWFYKKVHKQHHRFTYPSAVCAVYAHWFEFAFGNQIGVVFGPALLGCHPYVCRTWLALALGNTSIAHSGFVFADSLHLDAWHHDLHHEFFKCNYGVLGLCDWLFKTDASDYGFTDAKKDKVQRHAAAKLKQQ
jgi:sterol desaturase/sphingolipid hydroxylase (fatty acid hydroxylase superfamily)